RRFGRAWPQRLLTLSAKLIESPKPNAPRPRRIKEPLLTHTGEQIMQRRCWSWAIAGLLFWVAASEARALVAIARPAPGRAAQADAVVVGRVIALEPKEVEVTGPGGAKVTYRVAVVNVTETVAGVKEKSVRVAFVPPPMGPGGPAIAPAIRPIRPGFRGFGV